MSNKLGTFQSDWLTHSELNESRVLGKYDQLNQVFDMPDQTGKGVIDRYILPLGISISRACSFYDKFLPNKRTEAMPVLVEFEEDTFFFQHLKSGTNIFKEIFSGIDVEYGAGKDHYRFQSKIHIVNNFDMKEDIDLYSISVPISTLSEILGEPLALELLDKLNLLPAPRAICHSSLPEISSLIYSAFSAPYTGNMMRLHLQSKCIEIISLLCDFHINKVTKDVVRENKFIEAVHGELIKSEGRCITLDELSRKYAVSVKALTSSFEHRYGMSIARFILELRLSKAHDALLNTQIPIKILADRLGYAHVSNFTAAFTKKYSYSPAVLRKNKIK